jgi:hypothetical protein
MELEEKGEFQVERTSIKHESRESALNIDLQKQKKHNRLKSQTFSR